VHRGRRQMDTEDRPDADSHKNRASSVESGGRRALRSGGNQPIPSATDVTLGAR
jgi:hypothetical protein